MVGEWKSEGIENILIPKKKKTKKSQKKKKKKEKKEEQRIGQAHVQVHNCTWAFLSFIYQIPPTQFSLHFGEKIFWWAWRENT